MYEIQPVVCNMGSDEMKHLVSETDGRAFAERCTALSAILIHDLLTRSPVDAQAHFIDLVGPDENRDEVVAKLVQSPAAVVAEPLGLAVLVAYVLTYGTGKVFRSSRLLRTLMALNFETLREPGTETIRFPPESMSSAIASATLGFERYLNIRWRFRKFVEWSRSTAAKTHCSYVDLDAEIQAIFGMSYHDLVVAVTTIDAISGVEWMRHRDRPSFTRNEIVEIDQLGHVQNLLDRIAISRKALEDTVRGADLHLLRGIIHGVFLKSPVIALDQDTFVVPHGRLLENLVSFGWVYAIAEARRSRSDKESARLWRFFGDFFEIYITEIIERVCSKCGSTFWREQDLGQFKTSDAITKHRGEFQFLEVVSSRLNANILRDPADEAALDKDFERIVFEKIDQIAENIKRFMAGDFKSFGADPDQADAVYPILVQYRAFLRTDEFQARMEERFRDRLGASYQNVRPVEILDAEIIESLEEHLTAERTLGSLIGEKLGDGETRSATFKNFITSRHPDLELKLPPTIRALDAEWQGEIDHTAQGWRAS